MNPEENSPVPELKQIRTFQGDVAHALSREKESLVSIQRKEQARNTASTEPKSSGIGKKLLLLLGTLIFISLGALGAWIAYTQYEKVTAPPVISVPANRFIPAAVTTEVDVSSLKGADLISALKQAGEAEVRPGDINHILIREGSGETAELFSTLDLFINLDTDAPSSLIRAFDTLFMYGVLGGHSRFLIIELDSFENAFAGMLAWEPTMAQDIASIMSTEPVLKSITLQSVFEDVIDRNKDVRVLKASLVEGVATSTGVALAYSFYDNKTLLISDNLETIRALVDRLNREKLTR